MRRALYIFTSGELRREAGTLVLLGKDEKKAVPVEAVEELMVFSELRINKRLLEFLAKKHIPVHFFTYRGYYIGSFYPREYMNSGLMVLLQAKHFLDPGKRMLLAKAFVLGAISNMLFVLRVYSSRGKDLKGVIERILDLAGGVERAGDTQELMAVEGQIRDTYYSAFDIILGNPDFAFCARTRRPPRNRLNALISFGNSLLYITTLTQIYQTHLDPRIGYLHETNQRSFTLNLDIAEVFKPLIVDRVIFSLINRREIGPGDFGEEMGGIYMTEGGMRKFIKAYEGRLNETVYHKGLGRKVSHRRLIRLECYKLYRHFLDDEEYVPYIRTR